MSAQAVAIVAGVVPAIAVNPLLAVLPFVAATASARTAAPLVRDLGGVELGAIAAPLAALATVKIPEDAIEPVADLGAVFARSGSHEHPRHTARPSRFQKSFCRFFPDLVDIAIESIDQ